MTINHNKFLNLAFSIAKINLGKTKSNPSVGCVIVKNGSVISSGHTSINGRPHAEFNALNKKINFRNSIAYISMEPCTHYGQTPPCINIIINKGVKKIYYSFNDVDKRTFKKASIILKKKKIKCFKRVPINYKNFYQSYNINKLNNLPLLDAKIALSKDYFTINKKTKWITNTHSRKIVHLIRSEYDSIMTTSKTINKDNAILNCRLNGFNNNKPDLIIIDMKLKIKKSLKLFKIKSKRKIFLITTDVKNRKKISFLKKKGIKIIKIVSLANRSDFTKLFKTLKKKGLNRILVESGLIFLKELLKNNLIFNLFLFKSQFRLGRNGINNVSANFLMKFKKLKKIRVNLLGDELYKIGIKNV